MYTVVGPSLSGGVLNSLCSWEAGLVTGNRKKYTMTSMQILYIVLEAVIHLPAGGSELVWVIAGSSLLSRTVLSFEPVRRASTGGVSKFTSEYLLKAKPPWAI
jgi:hypothetical protein